MSDCKKPLHSVLIELMDKTADKDLDLIAFLLKYAEIRKNHDCLLAAWKARLAKVADLSDELQQAIDCLERRIDETNPH